MSQVSIAQFFKPKKCIALPTDSIQNAKLTQHPSPKSVVDDFSSDAGSIKDVAE